MSKEEQAGSQSTGTPWRTVHRRKNAHMLFAEDLAGRKSINVEIVDSGVIAVSDGDSDTEMPWLAFKGGKKRLGLNRGNCKMMETLTGTNIIEQWRGYITLVVVRTKYKDKKTKETYEVDAIRIAPTRPKMEQAQ